jgi:predicted RNase H-like HicB family nuclease
MNTFAAYIELDSETSLYVGIIPGIPGAHTQGANLDELRENLKEVLELCLEEYGCNLMPDQINIALTNMERSGICQINCLKLRLLVQG